MRAVLLRPKLLTIAVVAAVALVVGPLSGAATASPSGRSIDYASSQVQATTKVVPNVVGKTAYVAKGTLKKAGLKYSYKTPPGSFVALSKNWTVISQSPAAGTKAKKGTHVKLTVVKTATLGGGKATTPAAPAVPAAPALTVAQQQAVIAAKGYLYLGSGFSYQGLLDQLSSAYGNGFAVADATVAVNSLNIDFNAQAVLAAKSYLALGGFSHASMIEQLDSPSGSQFTPDQAEYATTQVGL